jgi:transposase
MLYGAIAPRSGDSYFLGLPKLTTVLFQRFLEEFAQARPRTLNVLLVDNNRCHTAQALHIPPNVILLFQPPYAPEVNPAERVWRALKDALAWHVVKGAKCADAVTYGLKLRVGKADRS